MCIGECTLCCQYKKSNYHIHFKIITGSQHQSLSCNTHQEMGLITVNTINGIQDSEDPGHAVQRCVSRYGLLTRWLSYRCTSHSATLTIFTMTSTRTTQRQTKRQNRGTKAKEVIKQVNKPTLWISSMVAVIKLGKIRIYVDSRDLNNAILCPKYQMPTLVEVLPKLANAKLFSVLDVKDGFHQVKLDEQSSCITKFGCH